MRKPFKRETAIAACLAALALAWPAAASDSDPHGGGNGLEPNETIANKNPDCGDVVNICGISELQQELQIKKIDDDCEDDDDHDKDDDDDDRCSKTKFNKEQQVAYQLTYKVTDHGVDLTALTNPANGATLAAIIGEGRKQANVYCVGNDTELNGITAPKKNSNKQTTPKRITACWAPPSPCPLTEEQRLAACAVYGDDGRKNYLQAHLILPNQPINVCRCDSGISGPLFCDSSLPNDQPGACPAALNDVDISAVGTQSVTTTGTATCHRVVIGGRAFFIGDTCESTQ